MFNFRTLASRRTFIATALGAFATVAAAGAAAGNIFFTAECGAAIATLAGEDFDTRFVNKFHRCSAKEKALPVRIGL